MLGNKENEETEVEREREAEDSSFTNDWTTYCSKNLKEPVSKKLVVNNSGKNCLTCVYISDVKKQDLK